jgi:hypothetical protein
LEKFSCDIIPASGHILAMSYLAAGSHLSAMAMTLADITQHWWRKLSDPEKYKLASIIPVGNRIVFNWTLLHISHDF